MGSTSTTSTSILSVLPPNLIGYVAISLWGGDECQLKSLRIVLDGTNVVDPKKMT